MPLFTVVDAGNRIVKFNGLDLTKDYVRTPVYAERDDVFHFEDLKTTVCSGRIVTGSYSEARYRCNFKKKSPSEKYVQITRVVNHFDLFLGPLSKEAEEIFLKLHGLIDEAARKDLFYGRLPPIGTLVIVWSGFYRRAVILKHFSNDEALVAFIDFGFMQKRSSSDLKPSTPEISKFNPLAFKYRLANIEQGVCKDEAFRLICRLMAEGKKIVCSNLNDRSGVITLFVDSLCINDMLNVSCKINVLREIIQRKIKISQMKIKLPAEDRWTGTEVVIIENSTLSTLGLLSFVPVADIKEFCETERRVQDVCNFLFIRQHTSGKNVYVPE